MISGIGFSEIFIVGLMMLLFFGSKELPYFMREAGKFFAKIRAYSNSVKKEINEVVSLENETNDIPLKDSKNTIRKEIIHKMQLLTDLEKNKKSKVIIQNFINLPEYKSAKAIMIYVSTENEVKTENLIKLALADSKRVIVPYCKNSIFDIGIAEITNFKNDLEVGAYNILEPKKIIHDNFFKSDLDLIVCPGIAFDKFGSRVGHGKGYYDRFLKEVTGKIPVVAFAFATQIFSKNLPVALHDVTMDMVITEDTIYNHSES